MAAVAAVVVAIVIAAVSFASAAVIAVAVAAAVETWPGLISESGQPLAGQYSSERFDLNFVWE